MGKAKKFHIWTVGCQMNKADSERLAGSLRQAGYQPTGNPEAADVIIVNSCSIRQSAEDRVAGKLGALGQIKRQRPEVKLALTGCMVPFQGGVEALERQFKSVDYFFPPASPERFLEVLPPTRPPEGAFQEEVEAPSQHSAVTAYVTAVHGCNYACSYCIVPFRRGPERSRQPHEVVDEVRRVAERGVREITLLGQKINSYGEDLEPARDLAYLLGLVHEVDGIDRIRFLTSHPSDLSDRLIEAMASLPKVCEQLNLPVQAGDDDLLRAMNRGYTVGEYLQVIERLRARIPELALATDVIVGFPGETRAQFEGTLRLLEQVRFDVVHVAAFSPRPGTVAAGLPDDVPVEEKRARLHEVDALQAAVAVERNAVFCHQTVEVLVENDDKGKWKGRTRGDKLVFFTGGVELTGRTVPVRIEKTTAWSMQGVLAS